MDRLLDHLPERHVLAAPATSGSNESEVQDVGEVAHLVALVFGMHREVLDHRDVLALPRCPVLLGETEVLLDVRRTRRRALELGVVRLPVDDRHIAVQRLVEQVVLPGQLLAVVPAVHDPGPNELDLRAELRPEHPRQLDRAADGAHLERHRAPLGEPDRADVNPLAERLPPRRGRIEIKVARLGVEPDGRAPAAEPATANGEPKLTKLSVEELQQLYTEVVGRDTGSSDKRYLVWKIREAKKGRIKTGPVRRRYADGEAPDMKVLPLRMDAEIVARLDEARERLGLKTRMDLFRKSLADYLTAAGEHEVAKLFTEQA